VIDIYTFQDFMKESNVATAVSRVISEHRVNPMTVMARDADEYDKQINTTISRFSKMIYTDNGQRVADPTASNNRLCSNFFNRLNTQRCTYSLGNGVEFNSDGVKEKLGISFDTKLKQAGYDALIHGVSFMFWNVDRVHVFPLTEFAPLWDEETGALRAGVRYWQIDAKKPLIAVLYEEDGYTQFKGNNSGEEMAVVNPKASYRITVRKTAEDAEPEVIAEDNYGVLPIIPVYGSRTKQSTLIGMKGKIDAFDLVSSGFANDLQDCAEIFWLVGNAGGMSDSDLARFRDRLKLHHIANVADADDVTITPYTQNIPTEAREAFLKNMRKEIYEDFGGLDVTAISASNQTATAIEAAYQPLDENADDYEYQIIDAVQKLLQLQDINDTPLFKRNRISNQKEITEMVLLAAQYLDDETILKKMPFITPDEVDEIMEKRGEQDYERFTAAAVEEPEGQDEEEEPEEGR